MTEDYFKTPKSNVEIGLAPREKRFSTLGGFTKLLLITVVTLDGLFALLFGVLLVYGAREFAFVFLLFYLSLAVFTYNTAVRRDTKLLWLFAALHLIPGFNLLVGPLALLVAWAVRTEVLRYAANEPGAD